VVEGRPEILNLLWENVERMHRGLAAAGFAGAKTSPIMPLVLGSPERALRVAGRLLDRGYYVPAIRPPSVPPGTARLRITVSAAHTEEEIEGFLTALNEALEGESRESRVESQKS
jgi:7-keto-8-aminopelargonate synthetase-like enzyme